MRKSLLLCFLLLSFVLSLKASTITDNSLLQILTGKWKEIPRVETPFVNVDSVLKKDLSDSVKGNSRYGIMMSFNMDFFSKAKEYMLGTNGKMFCLTIRSKSGTCLDVLFSKFYLPPGTQPWVFNNTLWLNGDYWPAGDYQPENEVKIRGANVVVLGGKAGELKLKKGSRFIIQAGKKVMMGNGFGTETGAYYSTEFTPCDFLFKMEPYDTEDYITEEEAKMYESLDEQTENMIQEKGISIVPNPNKGTFQLLLPFDKDFSCEVSVYDMTGKLVFQRSEIQDWILTIDIVSFPKGMYVVKVNSGQDSYSNSFVYQ